MCINNLEAWNQQWQLILVHSSCCSSSPISRRSPHSTYPQGLSVCTSPQGLQKRYYRACLHFCQDRLQWQLQVGCSSSCWSEVCRRIPLVAAVKLSALLEYFSFLLISVLHWPALHTITIWPAIIKLHQLSFPEHSSWPSLDIAKCSADCLKEYQRHCNVLKTEAL